MSPHSPPDEPPSWFVIKITAIASLGGCLFGYDMGAVSGALPQLQSYFGLTESQEEWVVSILYLGGGLGAAVGGTLCDTMGRRRAILGTDIVFMIGALWLYFANSYHQVLLGRFVVGIAIAVSGVADVSYLHEISPKEWRGAIVSANEACISLGFLLAYVAGYAYSGAENNQEWRIIFGWAGVVALVQFIGMWGMPESPLWLAEKGRMEESRRAWLEINGGGAAVDPDDPKIRSSSPATAMDGSEVDYDDDTCSQVTDVENIESSAPIETYQNSVGHTPDRFSNMSSLESYVITDFHPSVFKEIFAELKSLRLTLSRYNRQVQIALFLALTQQFCGQTNVLNYAPSIFAQAAGDDEAPAWSTLAIGIVKFIVTILVIWKIEFIGRRKLLIMGMSLIALGLIALIIAFGGSTSADPDNWATDGKSFYFALPGVLLVVCGYSMSFGPLTWLLTSELFPTDIRGRALGASTIVTYLGASFVTRTFLTAQSMFGPANVFAIYCICTIAGVLFAFLAIPDTGDKTAEQVEEAIYQMWWWDHKSLFALSQNEDESSFRPPSSDGLYTVNEKSCSQSFKVIQPQQKSGIII